MTSASHEQMTTIPTTGTTEEGHTFDCYNSLILNQIPKSTIEEGQNPITPYNSIPSMEVWK